MVVEVKTDSEFESGIPQVLFKTGILETGNTSFRNQYLPSADGNRFLINEVENDSSSPLSVTINWTADLPRH